MKHSLLLLALISLSAQAHQVPIRPNHIRILGDPGQLVVELQASAPWWIEDVFGGQTPPPHEWPETLQQKAKAYLDKHVQLEVDGHALVARLAQTRYNEEVWRYYGGSRLFFKLVYSLPEQGQTLSVRLTLYEEDRPKIPSETPNPFLEFLSYVKIEGSSPREFIVPIEQPQFTVPLADVLRTAGQRQRAQFLSGFLFWKTVPGVLVLFSALTCLGIAALTRPQFRGLLLVTLAGSLATIYGFTHEGPMFLIGSFLFLLIWTPGLVWALHFYRNSLIRDSESLAPALFASKTRLFGLLGAGAGLYLLVKGF